MSGKLVKTTYQTGPNDDLIVKDGYGGGGGGPDQYSGTKTGTSYDEKRDAAIDVLDQLQADSKELKTKTAVLNKNISASGGSDSNEPYSSSESNQRMSGGNTSVNGFLNDLSQNAQGLFNVSRSKSKLSSGSLSGNLSITDINAVLNIIDNLSGGNFKKPVKDKGAIKELVKTAVKTASSSGINGTYQALASSTNVDKDILVDAAKESIRETIKTGDISIALDVAQSSLMSGVIAKDPGLIGLILNSEALTTIAPKDRNNLFNFFFIAFGNSNSGWNTLELNSVEITDLKGNKISEQMKELLKYGLFKLPLTVYRGNENTINTSVDKQLTNPIDDGVAKALFGENVTQEQINTALTTWESVAMKTLVANHNRISDMYIGSQFFPFTVEEELDLHFEYVNAKVNSLVYK